MSGTKKQKMDIAKAIVEAIYSMDPPGRFLKKCPKTRQWIELLRYDHRMVRLKNHHQALVERQRIIIWEVFAHRLWHVIMDTLLLVGQVKQTQLMHSLQEATMIMQMLIWRQQMRWCFLVTVPISPRSNFHNNCCNRVAPLSQRIQALLSMSSMHNKMDWSKCLCWLRHCGSNNNINNNFLFNILWVRIYSD